MMSKFKLVLGLLEVSPIQATEGDHPSPSRINNRVSREKKSRRSTVHISKATTSPNRISRDRPVDRATTAIFK